MNRIFKFELFYIFKSIRFYVFLALTLAAQVLFSLFDKSNATAFIIAQLFSIVVAFEFAHKDFKFSTIKNIVGSGIGMQQIYFGKLFVTIISAFLIFLVYIISSVICSAVYGNLGDLNVAVKLLEIICYLGQTAVVFFICSIVTSGAFSIIIAIAYEIGLPILFMFVNNDIINAIKPFSLNMILSEINTVAGVSADVGIHLAVNIAVVALISVLGSFLFSKHKIK